jgi:hypothetical protein
LQTFSIAGTKDPVSDIFPATTIWISMDDMVNHHGFPLQDAPVKDGRTSKEFPLAGIQKDLGWGGDWCG